MGPYPTSISSALHPLILFLKILLLFPTEIPSAQFPLTKTSSNPHIPFLTSSTLVMPAPWLVDVPVPTKLRIFSPTIAKTVQLADRTQQFLEKASLSWIPFQKTLNDEALRGAFWLAAQSNLRLNLGPSLAACCEKVMDWMKMTSKAKRTSLFIFKDMLNQIVLGLIGAEQNQHKYFYHFLQIGCKRFWIFMKWRVFLRIQHTF